MNDSHLRKAALNMATSDEQDVDTTDTIAMAQFLRQHQGSFEMEVTCGGEADLQHHKKNCDKNPGHDQFVPVRDFNLEHLPPEYQDPDIVDLAKAQSDITVRIFVRHISDARPEFWLDGKTPYPFTANRVKYKNRMSRTGTGFVNRVALNSGKDNTELCTCYTCETTGKRQKTRGFIEIRTATHVVFDEAEGKTTKCHLFYDTSDTKLEDLPVLAGVADVRSDMKLDRTDLHFHTHDKDLADRLHKALFHYIQLHQRLYKKYRDTSYYALTRSPDDSSNMNAEHKLTIIVSHPHGCSKTVTVGQWIDQENFDKTYDNTQLIYSTKTCPGSSGALLCMIGSHGSEFDVSTMLHKGACKTPGLNCSGIGLDYIEMEMIIPSDKVDLFDGRLGTAICRWIMVFGKEQNWYPQEVRRSGTGVLKEMLIGRRQTLTKSTFNLNL